MALFYLLIQRTQETSSTARTDILSLSSTEILETRLQQLQDGMRANRTKKRFSVTLVYFEEFDSIDEVLYCDKQVQVWSRKKKAIL